MALIRLIICYGLIDFMLPYFIYNLYFTCKLLLCLPCWSVTAEKND